MSRKGKKRGHNKRMIVPEWCEVSEWFEELEWLLEGGRGVQKEVRWLPGAGGTNATKSNRGRWIFQDIQGATEPPPTPTIHPSISPHQPPNQNIDNAQDIPRGPNLSKDSTHRQSNTAIRSAQETRDVKYEPIGIRDIRQHSMRRRPEVELTSPSFEASLSIRLMFPVHLFWHLWFQQSLSLSRPHQLHRLSSP